MTYQFNTVFKVAKVCKGICALSGTCGADLFKENRKICKTTPEFRSKP